MRRKTTFFLFLVAMPLFAEDKLDLLLKVSYGTLGAASVADIRTSAGLVETNPILGVGPFGTSQIVKKVVGTVGLSGCSYYLSKRSRKMKVAMLVGNFAASAMLGYVASRNAQLK